MFVMVVKLEEQYEYVEIACWTDNMIEKMNYYGKNGWRLISREIGPENDVILLMEREIEL